MRTNEACQYLIIDTSSQNIWQIELPVKLFFDIAFSVPNAIITDKSNPCPINKNSFFDLYIGSYNIINAKKWQKILAPRQSNSLLDK